MKIPKKKKRCQKGIPPYVSKTSINEELLDILKSASKWDKIWDKISKQEAWILYLSLNQNFNQTQIGKELGLTQPSICYNLNRLYDRILFIEDFNWLTHQEIEEEIRDKFSSSFIDQVALYIDIGNQSEVGRRVGRSQGYIRHRMYQVLNEVILKEESKVKDSLSDLLLSPHGRSILWPQTRKNNYPDLPKFSKKEFFTKSI